MEQLYSSLDKIIRIAEKSPRFCDTSSSLVYGFVIEKLPSRGWKKGEFSQPEIWQISCFHNHEDFIIAIRETRFYPVKDHDDLFTLGLGVNKIEHNSMSEEDMLLLRLL